MTWPDEGCFPETHAVALMSEHAETVADRLVAIATEMSQIVKNPITVKGESGFYVNKNKLKKINELMDGAAEMATPSQADEVLALRNKVTELNAANKETSARMTEYLKYAKGLKVKLNEAHEKADDNASKHSITLSQMQTALNEQDELLKVMEKDLKYHKELAEGSDAKYDPELALKRKADVDKAKQDIIDGRAAKQAIIDEIKEHKAEREEILRSHAEAKRAHDEAWHLYGVLQNQIKMFDKNSPLVPRVIEEPGPLLKAFLGQHAMAWLTKLDAVNRADSRERAYNMMMLTMHSENVSVKALKVVIESAWMYIKKQGGKFLVRIDEWLTTIENDIRSRTVKSMKHYRQLLEEVVNNVEKARHGAQGVAKKLHKGAEKHVPFYQRATNKVKSVFKQTVSATWKFLGKTKNVIKQSRPFKWLFSWHFKRPTFTSRESKLEKAVNDSEKESFAAIVLHDAEAEEKIVP